jgi:hypothetical protein
MEEAKQTQIEGRNMTQEITKPVHVDRSRPAKRMLHDDGFILPDIARASSMSQATVSNFLNGYTDNAKVREALKKLYPRLASERLFGSDES